jgi:aryl-alcohol dehydrogenase-like predicted oxidoreductase
MDANSVTQLRPLGNTGLLVSRIGVGLAALGRPGYINLGHDDDLHGETDVASMESAAHDVLDTAWSAGVRYFDAARSYGQAEHFLASWIAARKFKPRSMTVGSKWGYTYTAGWRVHADRHEVKDLTIETLRRQATESKQILGPFLNLYQIHSATLESGVLEDRGVLEELMRVRNAGMCIGLTLTGSRQAETLQRAMDVKVDGERLFDCVQATWNLLESSVGPMLAQAHAAGMGVIIKEALANGRLTNRNNDPSFAAKRNVLAQAAARMGLGPDAIAIAAVLAQPWADIVLSGAATAAQLQSNLAASNIRWDRQMDEQFRGFAEPAEAYWATRARLPWN